MKTQLKSDLSPGILAIWLQWIIYLFHVGQGEIFGLLGPNGAGKTTAINLILGLLKAHQGEIRVLGFDINSQTRQVYHRIGYVPQETNLYQDLSAIDNLWHHAALYCQDLSSVKDRMEELLHFTNLWQRRKDPVRTFSGGMKRRLALARALLHDPEVIFFDEPTLGVDVQGQICPLGAYSTAAGSWEDLCDLYQQYGGSGHLM